MKRYYYLVGVIEPESLEFDKLSVIVVGEEGAVLANSVEFDKLGIVIIGEEPL